MTLAVQKHLVASQKFLKTVVSLSTYEDLEKKQCQGLLRALDKVQSLSAGVAAGLLETLDSTLWTPHSVQEFRLRVAGKTAPAEEEETSARTQQDFLRLPYFLTETLYSEVIDPQRSNSDVLLDKLCVHAAALGLRCPSEKTMAVIVVLSQWARVEAGLTEKEEYDLLHQKKKRLKKNFLTLPDGEYCPVCLPGTVTDLPDALVRKLFPAGKFVSDKEWCFRVWKVASQWCCRESHRAVAAQKSKGSTDKGNARVDDIIAAFQKAQDLTPRKGVKGSLRGRISEPTAPTTAFPAICDGRVDAGAKDLPVLLDTSALTLTEEGKATEQQAPSDSAQAPRVAEHCGPARSTAMSTPALASVEDQLRDLRASAKTGTSPKKKPASKVAQKRPAASLGDLDVNLHKRTKSTPDETRDLFKRPSSKGAVTPKTSHGLSGEKQPPAGVLPKGYGKRIPSHAVRVKMMPNGCGTCRHVVGCTPSCWVKKGWVRA
eukprot:Skav208639  [mRNA]  locus=scaffold1081:110247:111707:+ [translate_table: standard]